MKVGDRVKHKTKKGVVGIICSFVKYDGALVDLSDKSGIKFRKFKVKCLEVINEEG